MPASTTFRAYALLSPALVTVTLVLTVCLGIMLVLSFSLQNYLDIEMAWTFQNYLELLGNASLHNVVLRTVVISGVVTILSLLFAYPMAYFVAFDLERNKLAWLLLMTLPFWISYLLRILSWKVILGYNGVINAGLVGVGIVDEPLDILLYNPGAVTIALTHAWAPFALLPIYVSLEKIDRSLIAAASDLGDSPFFSFLRITLPLSMPGVAAAALLIFIPTFGDYITPSLIGGPNGMMVGNFIAIQFGTANNWPLGSAMAISAMIIATGVACFFVAGTGRVLRQIR